MKDYSFGNFLSELRERSGLSQYQLGSLVGVSNKAVSKWENGLARPNSRVLPKLSSVLGVTIDELLACKYHISDEKERMLDMPKWYLGALKKMRYLFPKAHGIAYVQLALKLAWYKVNYPERYASLSGENIA